MRSTCRRDLSRSVAEFFHDYWIRVFCELGESGQPFQATRSVINTRFSSRLLTRVLIGHLFDLLQDLN